MIAFEKLFSLNGKTAIVTGASRGIGKVVAAYIAAAGADIVVTSTNEEEALAVADEISAAYGVKTAGFGCDIRSEDQIETMVRRACRELGTVDLLFNNAGIVLHKTAVDCPVDQFNNVLSTNLTGTFLVARAVAKRLIAEGKPGSIVNNASIMGKIVALPQRQSAYNASKAAVIHMTKSLAVEWAEHSIRVNTICPAYILSDMTHFVKDERRRVWIERTPFGRLGNPEELAGAVIYYLSDASTYTTGSQLLIDGGYTCV
jgi:NAD(P)-dependent dehydrogenase (short-subunit alcohol dehydrogenase family)